MRFAFKEWGAVCQALAAGRQSLILRKGGIAESGGEFRPEHQRFWLYPTRFHEHPGAIKPEAVHWRSPPADLPGIIMLSHVAEVVAIHRVWEWPRIVALDSFHIWSQETVLKKFEYRHPGVYVLTVRVFAASPPWELVETPAFAGCHTWVELPNPVPESMLTPVLSDAAFAATAQAIRDRLNDQDA